MTKPVVTFGTAAFAAFTYDDESRPSAAVRWPDWLERFKIFLDASGIENESQKKSLLLHLIGDNASFIGIKNIRFTFIYWKID